MRLHKLPAALAVVGLLAANIAGIGPAAQATPIFTNIVDTTMTAPGHGAFANFAFGGGRFPSISGSNVAFQGTFSGGEGIYTGSVGATGAAKIVDTGDNAPGRGAFSGFEVPSISGNNVAIHGFYGTGTGIYTASVGATGATKIVDFGSTAPGHGNFNSFFGTPVVSGNNLTFLGFYSGGSGGAGIYTGNVGVAGRPRLWILATPRRDTGPSTVLAFPWSAGATSRLLEATAAAAPSTPGAWA